MLDWRLETETASPVADRLTTLSVPFLFHTSSRGHPEAAHPGVPIIDKPTICSDLREVVSACDLRFAPDGPIPIATDRAVRVALLATELITNAAKHAYPAETGGPIVVKLIRTGDIVTLSIRDRGAGLPEAQSGRAGGGGLGMRIIRALTTQTGGTLDIRRAVPGTEFAIALPLEAQPSSTH